MNKIYHSEKYGAFDIQYQYGSENIRSRFIIFNDPEECGEISLMDADFWPGCDENFRTLRDAEQFLAGNIEDIVIQHLNSKQEVIKISCIKCKKETENCKCVK